MEGEENAELIPMEGSLEIPLEEESGSPEFSHISQKSQASEEKDSFVSPWDASALEPYPHNSDGEMLFKNLMTKLKAPPRSIIDYMGRKSSAVLSAPINLSNETLCLCLSFCLAILQVLNRRRAEVYAKSEGLKLKAKEYHVMEEEAARVEKENRRKMQRKRSRRYTTTIARGDRLKTLASEDSWLLEGAAVEEFMVGEEERMASKEDVQRLKKIRHDATQEVFDQSVQHKDVNDNPADRKIEVVTRLHRFSDLQLFFHHVKSERMREAKSQKQALAKRDSTTIARPSETISEEAEADQEAKVTPEVSKPQLLSRLEMENIISGLREVVGGDDEGVGRIISSALAGKQNGLDTLIALVQDTETRDDFLNTITEPGYVFFLLNCHFRSSRAVLNMINIVLSDNPARSLERVALTRKLNEALGVPPGGGNTKLMNFAHEFEEACRIAVEGLLQRVGKGRSIVDVDADFRECMHQEEIHMVEFAETADLEVEELKTIISLTLSCRIEELKEFFDELAPVQQEIEAELERSPDAEPDVRFEDASPSRFESKEIPVERSSEENEQSVNKSFVKKTDHSARHSAGEEEQGHRTVVQMRSPPVQLTQDSPLKTSAKPILLKGKTTKKGGDKSPQATLIDLTPLKGSVLGVSTVPIDSTEGRFFWDEEEEEEEESEEEEEDEIDFMEVGEKIQLLEYLSADEEGEDEGEDSSSKASSKSRRKRIKYHKQRRKRAQQQEIGEEGREGAEAEQIQSKETRSSGSEPQDRSITEEEALQKAADDEETCMALIAMVSREDDLEKAENLLKKISRIIRNDEGTMDIEAIMRVYNELQNAILSLQKEMELIPEGSDERNVIDSIISAIKETSKTLVDADEGEGSEQTEDQQKASKHDSIKEKAVGSRMAETGRAEKMRKRLESMIKRRKKPRLQTTTPRSPSTDSESDSSGSDNEGFEFRIQPLMRRKMVKDITIESLSEEEGEKLGEFVATNENIKKAPTKEVSTSKERESLIVTSAKTVHQTESERPTLEEQAAYVVEVAIGKIAYIGKSGRTSGDRLRSDLQPNSKLVQSIRRKSDRMSAGLLKEDMWRRQKTRSLITRMQKKLSPLVAGGNEDATPHALKPSEIREALTNPDFEEIAQEFKTLYGAQLMKSSSYNLLTKITQQMDTISTKIGEEPGLDKMMNLLSILKYQDRKFTADELLTEVSLSMSIEGITSWQYFEELDPDELKYMEEMLTVVKELLLIEFSITSAMLPSQRIAWMSIPGNWENHRRCLAILGQLLQLQVILPELASIVVSALVMNVFDTIAIFNARDIITNDIEKMVYGYLKDEIEALSWFHVHMQDRDEVLKPLMEEYDAELGNLLGGEDSSHTIKPSVDKSLLDLVVAPGYTYVLQTGLEKGFAISRVEDQIERTSSIEYMLHLRRLALSAKHKPHVPPVEVVAEEVEKTIATLENAPSIAAALEATGTYDAAERTFTDYYCRVATEKQCARVSEIFQSVISVSQTQRKVNVEELLFTRDTDNEILGDLEETTNILHQHSLSPSPEKQKPVYQLYAFGRQVSTDNPEDVMRILATSLGGGRFYERQSPPPTQRQQMYTIQGAEQLSKTEIHFPGLNQPDERRQEPSKHYPSREKEKLPYLPQQSKSLALAHTPATPLASLWRFHASSSEKSDMNGEPMMCNYTQLSAYRYSRTPHVASHNYPLTRREVEAVECFLEMMCKEKGKSPELKADSKIETTTKRSTMQKKSSSLDQGAVTALFKEPDAMHILRRNPAAILEQLRQRLKPGGLTQVLDEVMRETGSKKSKKLFLQALQKAVSIEKEAKQQFPRSSVSSKRLSFGGRTIRRPAEIPSRDWQRLAKSDTTEFERLPMTDDKRPHCRAEYICRSGYVNIVGASRGYLSRLDVLQHLHRANHLRANDRIHKSIEEW
ncbi:unnamed protein product [Hydatigera taeniaeformis]|uniref:DUF1716 domain-containing protein n=1 Tax=Hydatigena taeniaeformis TaxID=6205 RepID=A0A0R3WZR8_HYDTA|nr:unnamed protein product [Hydatigera taeniaeformis]